MLSRQAEKKEKKKRLQQKTNKEKRKGESSETDGSYSSVHLKDGLDWIDEASS